MAFSALEALSSCATAFLLMVAMWVHPCTAQRCNTLLTFNGSSFNFTKCINLAAQNSLLAWTFNEENATLEIAFEGVAPSTSGWVGWGINPTTPGQMMNSSALIAFQAVENGSNVLPYKLTSQVQLLQVPLTCSPVDLVIQATAVEIVGTSMRFFAILQLERNKTVLHHVWNRGSTVRSFQPQQHGLAGENLRSFQTIDMFTAQMVAGGAGPPHRALKRAHGVVNTLSWGILLPLGAIFARYLRQVPALDRVWFYVHVPCQVVGYLLGTAGWAIGMRLLALSSAVRTTHRNIGITLFVLASIQVCALLYHPKKKDTYRRYWEVYHHMLGYTVVVLSIINVFLGLNILDPGGGWRPGYIASLSILAFIAVVLEISSWAHYAYSLRKHTVL